MEGSHQFILEILRLRIESKKNINSEIIMLIKIYIKKEFNRNFSFLIEFSLIYFANAFSFSATISQIKFAAFSTPIASLLIHIS